MCPAMPCSRLEYDPTPEVLDIVGGEGGVADPVVDKNLPLFLWSSILLVARVGLLTL